MSDDNATNVVTVNFGAGETSVKDHYGQRFCSHARMELDTKARSVACGTCGQQLDAFQILLDYAVRERNWRHYDVELRELSKKLEELKAEEQRVKARTKTADRKEAAAAVAAERQRHRDLRERAHRNAQQIVALAERIARSMKAGASLEPAPDMEESAP